MSELPDWDVDSKAAKAYDEAHTKMTSPMTTIATYNGVYGLSLPYVASSASPPGTVQMVSKPLQASLYATNIQSQHSELNKRRPFKSHGFTTGVVQHNSTVIILAVLFTTVLVALIAVVSYFVTRLPVPPSDVSESPSDLVTAGDQTTEESGTISGPCSSNPCPDDITCVNIDDDFFCECTVCNCTADLVNKTCGTIPSNITGSCDDLGIGFYPVVTNCSKYLWCYDGGEAIKDCAVSTAYSLQNPPCDHPSDCSVTFTRNVPT